MLYVAAIQKAYSGGTIANPEIRYSHQRGFYVEDVAVPWEDDVIWYEQAGYHDDGKKMARPKFYTETRRHICNIKEYFEEIRARGIMKEWHELLL